MKETWNWIQIGIVGAGGFLGWFLGGADGSLFTLLAFVVVDYITGVLRAVNEKKIIKQYWIKRDHEESHDFLACRYRPYVRCRNHR